VQVVYCVNLDFGLKTLLTAPLCLLRKNKSPPPPHSQKSYFFFFENLECLSSYSTNQKGTSTQGKLSRYSWLCRNSPWNDTKEVHVILSFRIQIVFFMFSLIISSEAEFLDVIGTKNLESFPPCYSQSPLLTDPPPPPSKSGLDWFVM
jgi:hypothetical protein